MREHPCPANANVKGACPGFVVDHIIPLACGGESDEIETTAAIKPLRDTFKKKPVKSAQIISTEPGSSRDIPAKHSSL